MLPESLLETTRFLNPLNSPDETTKGVGQQFLRFHLEPATTALLPVNQLTEVLTIAIGQIIPIPHLPACVMGVHNWRGEILWMVDLGHLIGLTPLHQQVLSGSTYTAVVIHPSATTRQTSSQIHAGKMLGLVVHRVEDMEWCNPDLIQSPPASAISPALAPFLRGHWLNAQAELAVVLEGDAIVQSFSN